MKRNRFLAIFALLSLSVIGFSNAVDRYIKLNDSQAVLYHEGKLAKLENVTYQYEPRKFFNDNKPGRVTYRTLISLQGRSDTYVYENQLKIKRDRVSSFLSEGDDLTIAVFSGNGKVWEIKRNGNIIVPLSEETNSYLFWTYVNFGGALLCLISLFFRLKQKA